jgi:hypothetical protein
MKGYQLLKSHHLKQLQTLNNMEWNIRVGLNDKLVGAG